MKYLEMYKSLDACDIFGKGRYGIVIPIFQMRKPMVRNINII